MHPTLVVMRGAFKIILLALMLTIDAMKHVKGRDILKIMNYGSVATLNWTQLMRERITVYLEWTVLLSQIYYQLLLQNVSVRVVPDPEMTTVNMGNRTLQLTLLYNTLYNVTERYSAWYLWTTK